MDDYQLLAPESVSKFSQNFQNQIAGEIMTSLLASKDHKVGRHMCCYCAFKFRFSQPVTSPFIFISTKPKSPISENSSFSWWKLENLKIPFDTGILWKPWCLRTGGRLTSQIHTWAKKHPLLSRREAQTQHIPVPHTHTHTPSKKENLGFFDLNKGGKAQSRQAFGGLSCSNPKNSQHKKTSIQFFFSF